MLSSVSSDLYAVLRLEKSSKILEHISKFLDYRAIVFVAISYPDLLSFDRKQSFERNVGEMKNYVRLLLVDDPVCGWRVSMTLER